MKFVCNKNELSEAISCVSKAVPQKSTMQSLEGIKVKVSENEVELTAYNLEMGIRTSIRANTDTEFAFVASSRLFNEFTKKMECDNITVELDENNVIRLSNNITECCFSAMLADEYPDLPVVDAQRSFSVQQSVLKSMINMTSYAVSQSENKPIFTGELFDIIDGKFTLVAIDGFRLAISTENIATNDSYHFVVPKKALQEVSALIHDDAGEKDCNISINDRHIIFEIDNFFVISRLLEGAFHNYKLSIPDGFKTEVFVNKKDFVNSLERCSLIINEKNRSPIRCEVGGGMMKISCKTSIGRVNDAISADVNGENVTIGFNNRLVLEALKAADSDKIRIRFNGSMKVIEILPPMSENYIFLVMPIQIKG